jgi:hypothetical protein
MMRVDVPVDLTFRANRDWSWVIRRLLNIEVIEDSDDLLQAAWTGR